MIGLRLRYTLRSGVFLYALYSDWAAIVPMANESEDFVPFIAVLKMVLDRIEGGKFYFVIDNASKDNTLELSRKLSEEDPRFVTVWSPENRNVVDA